MFGFYLNNSEVEMLSIKGSEGFLADMFKTQNIEFGVQTSLGNTGNAFEHGWRETENFFKEAFRINSNTNNGTSINSINANQNNNVNRGV